jgi:transposase
MSTLMNSSMPEVAGSSSPAELLSGARRATDESSAGAAPPDSEVSAIARRRRFTSAEKRRILAQADRCTKRGELGALLRRERIFSSMLAAWRKQRDIAEQAALAPKKRGRKPDAAVAERRQAVPLKRENARLRRELERAHAIIDVQKKLCTLLGLPTAEESDLDK